MTTTAVSMSVLGLLFGLVAARVVIHLPRAPVVLNFRGRRVPVVGGMAVAAAFFLAEAAAAPWAGQELRSRANVGAVALVTGFFLLGLLDDYSPAGQAKGLRGHLNALRRGEITTGLIKATGGLLLALAVAAFWDLRPAAAAADGLMIALSANLANLLDLRPGRAVKAYLLAWLPLAFAARGSPFSAASAAVTGAAVAWLPTDLSEKAILGDAGSNLLGAVAGGAAALVLGPASTGAVLALLASLTLLSEKYSFTRAIAAAPPLRWIDSLGRTPENEMPESFPNPPE